MLEGLALGVITWLSLIFTFSHLPEILKVLLLKYPLATDVLATGLCFIFLAGISQSILSVIGSITCGLLVNITMKIYKKIKKK